MTPEGMVEHQIFNYLRFKGVFAFKVKTMGTYDAKAGIFRRIGQNYRRGVSDIIGIFNHRFLAIEVKSAKGRATPEQLAFLSDVNVNGGIAILARSVEDVEKGLAKWR